MQERKYGILLRKHGSGLKRKLKRRLLKDLSEGLGFVRFLFLVIGVLDLEKFRLLYQ